MMLDINEMDQISLKKDKKHIHRGWIVGAILLFCIYILVNVYRSYNGIQIAHYEINTDKISESVKMVIIGDLHELEYGEGNEELFTLILEQKPDVVLMVGDMLNDNSENADVVVNLIEELVAQVPVYYAMGNHELRWEKNSEKDISVPLEAAGAVVLDEAFCDIKVNGQNLRIGGMYSGSLNYDGFDPDNITNYNSTRVQKYLFLDEFYDTDSYKLLLSHRPDAFAVGDASKMWDIDLVVGGHLHGGQIVLPFLGGVSGGEQGWFSEYVHGLYKKDKVSLLITNGLGSKLPGIPRWNNPPEIVVVELVTFMECQYE